MTSSSALLTGSIVALVTPMHEDGSVDYPQLRKLIDWHIAEGTDCIGVVGTTGESPTVNVEEHCEIIRVAVEQAAKRVPIMAGCGANSTREAIELAQFAKKVGFDRIFIGGTGSNVKEIINWSYDLLEENGILVMNFITIENFYESLSYINEHRGLQKQKEG